ncbi:MAG: VWA domain-containing protein [Acidobacteria bacterium]|nr:VWA domain-containing protein [Acidobacteriota bacterium]
MPLDPVAVRIGAVAIMSSVALLVGNAQQPPPKFKSSVEAVVLDVSVLDKDRRPVRGLTASDFTVLEDGKPQEIGTFTAIDLEDVIDVKAAPWTRQVAPDIRRNDDFRERRVVVIVMDSSTPMPAPEVPQAKRLGRSVVEGLAPDDLAAVVHTFGKGGGQTFTHDRAKLLAAVDRFNGTPDGGWTMAFPKPSSPGAPADAILAAVTPQPFTQFDRSGSLLNFYFSTISTLRDIAEDLAGLPDRRKALFFVSVGIPLDVTSATEPNSLGMAGPSDVAQILFAELRKVYDAARRSNVNIYSVDPGGLRIDAAPFNQDFLRGVSAATGGFAITDTNDPAPGIQQIYRENGSYYLLGYQPSSSRTNGRFRKVEVKVNRPSVTVRSRSGYFEPTEAAAATKTAPAKAKPEEVSALEGLLPKSDIALRVHAVPFAKDGGTESEVAIILQGHEPIPAGSTATAEDLTVLFHAYSMQAELKASDRLTAHLRIRAGAVNDLRYGLLSRLTLKPGRYQLRLSAKSSMSGKSGSVYIEVDVPDYSKAALSLSDVMFEATPSPVASPRGKLASLIPIVPTAERDFLPGDTVTAFARVYQGGRNALQAVAVTTRIVDRAGAEVFSKVESLAPDRFATARSANLLVSIPIGTLAPGPHLLSISTTRGNESAHHEVRFTVHAGSGGWPPSVRPSRLHPARSTQSPWHLHRRREARPSIGSPTLDWWRLTLHEVPHAQGGAIPPAARSQSTRQPDTVPFLTAAVTG